MLSLIHQDQVEFIMGRQAPDATRHVLDLLQRMESCGMPSLFLSLGADKAFNRVHRGYLDATLCKFGFQGWIASAIKSLYVGNDFRHALLPFHDKKAARGKVFCSLR